MIKKKQRTFLQKLTTLLMFSMVFAVGAWAQLTNGKVYNFESIGRAGKSLSSSDKCDNGQATTNHANPHQLWIAVEGKGKNQGKFVFIIAKTKCAFFQNEMCIFCIFFAVSQLVLNGLLNGF